MRIALASLNQHWLDKESNFARCVGLCSKAVANGAALLIFPEMTLTGYSMNVAEIAEARDDSTTLRRFRLLARESNLTVVFGACLLDTLGDKPKNQLCVANPDGSCGASYAKIHPFSYAGEDDVIGSGTALGYFELQGLRFGLSICYDLRFPELFTAMAPNCGAVITIANWPSRRGTHWQTLLAARAIENQFYAIGVNRIGTDGSGLQYDKSSMVVAPDGSILPSDPVCEELDIYTIDPFAAASHRAAFPTVSDKRYGVYRDLFAKL